jgi:prefoldin subunit 5
MTTKQQLQNKIEELETQLNEFKQQLNNFRECPKIENAGRGDVLEVL